MSKRLLTGLGVAMMAIGLSLSVHGFMGDQDADLGASQEPTVAMPTYHPTEAPTASSEPQAVATVRPFEPSGIIIPSLGVAVPVLPIQTQGVVLTPPPDPQTVGWWQGGMKPGSKTGATLLTGHTVHTGGGALDDLEKLQINSVVVVENDREQLRYRVESVKVMSKSDVAREAPRLFAQNGDPRLVLITCEDYDAATGEYASNVVVVGKPVS